MDGTRAGKLRKTDASLRLEKALRGRGASMDVYGPVAANEKSEVYYGTGPHYPTPVAIKLCLGHGAPLSAADTAAASFHFMQRLHGVTTSDPALASPKPYALIPELSAVVAEWVPGQGLDAFLTRAPDDAALAVVREVGAWLARLASAAGYSQRPLETEWMLQGVEADGEGSPLRQAIALLRETAGLAREREVVWSRCFGDFKPANLMLCDGRIYGLDSQMAEIGPGVIDAAHFLNHVALLRANPLSRDAAAWTARLDEAFRQGHEADAGLELPALQLLWTRLHSAVRLALGYRTWARPPRAWITGWLMRRLLRHLHGRLEACWAGPRHTRA